MLTSKDANFVGYTYKNSDVFKGMMNSPIGMTLYLPAINSSVLDYTYMCNFSEILDTLCKSFGLK